MNDSDDMTIRERLARGARGLRCAAWMRAARGLSIRWNDPEVVA